MDVVTKTGTVTMVLKESTVSACYTFRGIRFHWLTVRGKNEYLYWSFVVLMILYPYTLLYLVRVRWKK